MKRFRSLFLLPFLFLAACAGTGSIVGGPVWDDAGMEEEGISITLDADPAFIAYGDSRAPNAWFRIWNDGKEDRLGIRDAMLARAEETDFVLHLGDIVGSGKNAGDWNRFLRENRPLFDTLDFYAALGNHEEAGHPRGWANYREAVHLPHFYVLDSPHAAVFVVDSDIIVDQKDYIPNREQDERFRKWFVSEDPDRPSWLRRELEKRRDRTFKIVAMHHAPFSFYKHRKDWTNRKYGNDLAGKRKDLIHLLEEFGVQLVLCSHDHLYDHSVLEYPFASPESEMHFIISGGGGVNLRDATPAEETDFTADFRVTSRNRGKIHHFCSVSVSPDRLDVEVVAVEKNAARTFDAFSIPAAR